MIYNGTPCRNLNLKINVEDVYFCGIIKSLLLLINKKCVTFAEKPKMKINSYININIDI